MLKTYRDRSLKNFSYEIHYLSDPSQIEHIGNANHKDVLFARCYPNRIIHEPAFKKIIKENESLLLKKMEEISETFGVFYSHFDIDFKKINAEHVVLDRGLVGYMDIRPRIEKKNITNYPSGFFNLEETPQE